MTSTKNDPAEDVDAPEADAQPERLHLDVKIDSKSACERHVTVTVPREDIDRYYDKTFSDLVPKAAVPGFRAGRAPRKLVEARFRKDVTDQVKGALLMDSLEQVSTDHDLAPISEPDFDPESVVVPDSGPMTFEFEIEVRPSFDVPDWKGLKIDRAVKDFTAKDIDAQLNQLLMNRGRLVPFDGAAKTDDYIVCNLSFQHDGEDIAAFKEETIRIRKTLSFRDGTVEGFDKLMKGVKAGETREGEAKLTDDAPNEKLRGQKVKAVFEVLEVKKLELPELTPEFLEEVGGLQSEDELRDEIKKQLERRLEYHQQQQAREQVLKSLTVAADWDLPPALLKRQSRRELERAVLELRRNGFGEGEIQAHANELSQNSAASTSRALKQHFILEKIAEQEKIEDSPQDYDDEVALIAQQSGESPRRVRAQLEKRGLMDTLRNQIIERKTIELILGQAKFKDVPYEPEKSDAEALDRSAGGEEESEIPEAVAAPEALGQPNQPRAE